MNKQQLINSINQGESETLEFKSSFNKAVIETIVAFSNTKGGKVLIGVQDSKEIIGIDFTEETVQKWLNEVKQNTHPQVIPNVNIENIQEKTIVVFEVSEYPVKPVSFKNKYYKRVLNSNHLMSIDEISNEHLKTMNSSWDFYPDINHTYQDLSEQKVMEFMKTIESRSQSKIQIAPFGFLSKFEMIRDQKPTFGAYLLFANDYCAISDIQVGRFKSEITIIDSISISTDLFQEVNQVISFIKKHLMVEYIITGDPQRIERFDYPLDAIREVVINMIVHRDYRDSSASIIKIFDDRIEFFNPGKLYGNLTIKDLITDNYTSQTRNKLIAKAFKEIGLIERYGSGIKRIFTICQDYGVKEPLFEEVAQGFKVVLFKQKDKVTDKVTDNVTDKVTDNQQKMIDLIKENPFISTKQIAEKINISQRKVKENMAKLKQNGFVKRVGSTKSGQWELT